MTEKRLNNMAEHAISSDVTTTNLLPTLCHPDEKKMRTTRRRKCG